MTSDGDADGGASGGGETLPGPAERVLPEAARRALAEAEARRAAATEPAMPKEIGGRKGKEPARYGDWEVKGLATDF